MWVGVPLSVQHRQYVCTAFYMIFPFDAKTGTLCRLHRLLHPGGLLHLSSKLRLPNEGEEEARRGAPQAQRLRILLIQVQALVPITMSKGEGGEEFICFFCAMF